MKTGFTKNEKIFSTITLLVVAGFFTAFKTIHFKSSKLSQFGTVEAINYNMARPEQGYAGYSLEGREIDENYEAIQAKKLAAEKAKVAAAKKVKEEAKKAEAKKQEAKVAKTENTSKTVSKNETVHTTKNINTKTHSTNSENNDFNVYSNNRTTAAANETKAAATESKNTDDKKAKKSFAQWRSEIYAAPTKETMTLFITAFRKGELTSTEYQAMAQDLLDQNDANLKGLGLMALRSQPSLASLSQLVHIESTLPAQLQAYVQQSYLAYFQAQNVQILNQALMTKDKTLVVKSLSLLTANLQKIKTGDVAAFTDARARRDLSSESVSMDTFKMLIPSLTLLASAQEQDVSSVARQVVGLIG